MKTENSPYKFKKIENVSIQAWENQSKKKIYFGHQSLGNNIISGINSILSTSPSIKLNIRMIHENERLSEPVFAHSQIGKNKDPELKINEFDRILNSGVGDTLDIAILKFCYVDIHKRTKLKEVFDLYKLTLSNLKNRYPNTQFIHFTVPLRRKEKGIKGFVYLLKSKEQNCRRARYNELIRKEFRDEIVFDLAKIESTFPDGRTTYFNKDCYSLVPDYTDDGGHLNEFGKKIIAEQFLIFLAGVAEK
jgi:hypothetical protein